ncbi:MAG: hypothetical protein IID45_09085 [Planctomycetes bacterium]|nr:hypothetical protein [Planctomycetota bacterium]
MTSVSSPMKNGGRKSFLGGLSLVGIGGWMFVSSVVTVLAALIENERGLRFSPGFVWRLIGGMMILAIGFLFLVRSATLSFVIDHQGEAAESDRIGESSQSATLAECRPDSTAGNDQQFGPPKPIVMIRCRRCESLNHERRTECASCGDIL